MTKQTLTTNERRNFHAHYNPKVDHYISIQTRTIPTALIRPGVLVAKIYQNFNTEINNQDQNISKH